jgi:hypothetical protein
MSQCPFGLRIDDFLLGRMSAADQERFEEHLFQCDACFRETTGREAVLAAVRRHGARIFAPGAAAPAKPAARRRWMRLWPYAATAALLLAAWIGFAPGRRAGGRVPLAPPGSDAVRGAAVALIAPSGALPAVPSALEWEPAGGAADYSVSLSGPGLAWSGRTAAARIEIPADIRARIVPGTEYRWKVRAFAPQGGLTAASPEASFRIAE